MKKIFRFLKPVLPVLALGLLFAGCKDDSVPSQGHTAAINVSTKTLEPNATGSNGESGTIKAFVGTVVTAQGFNLDQVTSVTLGGMECEVVEQTISLLKFKVPALELAQSDTPYQQDLQVLQGDNVIFRYDYYVTIPVTDAIVTGYSPAAGSVGSIVKIEGRNLEQVAEVHFGEAVILSDSFTEVVAGSTNSSVSFAVPAGNYPEGASEVAISAIWGGNNTLDVTGEVLFTMQTPKVNVYTQEEGVNAVIGDEFTLTGEFIDMLSNFKWGAYELIVLEQSAEAVTLKFPSSIEAADPVVVAADVTAEWGTPAQIKTLVSAMRLDTTPQGPAKPVFESMSAEEGYFLAKVVSVKGQNMASIEKFVVGGLDAVLSGEPNDVEAKFIIPEDFEFDAATEVTLEAVYGGGTKVDFGTIKIYPFYCFKGVKLGLGSNSKGTYTDFAAANAFFYPDLGKVVSTTEWLDGAMDPYAATGSNPAVKAAGVLTTSALTEEEYYGVLPYMSFIANSSHKLSIAGCANSSSQLKCHFIWDDAAAEFSPLPNTFGTPLMYYRVLANDNTWSLKVKSGDLESLVAYDGSTPGQGAPALGKPEAVADGKTWAEDTVIAVGYSSYAAAAKPTGLADLAKVGFIHIKVVTCADLSTGLANADRAGYIEFDFYWSKRIK